ncbi:unnamed protein product [Albugo candida]|uniref:Uncharacterized protein n=1 Tax=Albugo candida TaxID=65357 RepID=A0A024GNI6_9STRA|nr:unnamed protein product [Albugo candida]|eukprot:CCI48355.1 unnamed protein product [Albugo candida]
MHMTAYKEYKVDDSEWNPIISGFAVGVGTKAEGCGTILLAVMIAEHMIFFLVEEVLATYREDMIQNSAIPGHSDLDETQESNVGGCDEAQSSLIKTMGDIIENDMIGSGSENASRHRDAESVDHIADLITIDDDVDDSSDDEIKYECLSDSSDQCEVKEHQENERKSESSMIK